MQPLHSSRIYVKFAFHFVRFVRRPKRLIVFFSIGEQNKQKTLGGFGGEQNYQKWNWAFTLLQNLRIGRFTLCSFCSPTKAPYCFLLHSWIKRTENNRTSNKTSSSGKRFERVCLSLFIFQRSKVLQNICKQTWPWNLHIIGKYCQRISSFYSFAVNCQFFYSMHGNHEFVKIDADEFIWTLVLKIDTEWIL